MKKNKLEVSEQKFNLRKNNKKLAAIAILLLFNILFLAGLIIQKNMNSNYIALKAQYSQQADSVQETLNGDMKAVNEAFLTNHLVNLFSKSDLNAYTSQLWSYELYINNNLITNNDVHIKISGEVVITLKESYKINSLPDAILQMGNVTGGDKNDSIYKHIIILGNDFKPTSEKIDNVNTYHFIKQNSKSGEAFSINLSMPLAQKLGFSDDIIKVTIE